MISQDPEQPVVAGIPRPAHGDPRSTRRVVGRVAATRPFVVTAHESRGHIADGCLDPLAVPIEDKGGRDSTAADTHQAVLE